MQKTVPRTEPQTGQSTEQRLAPPTVLRKKPETALTTDLGQYSRQILVGVRDLLSEDLVEPLGAARSPALEVELGPTLGAVLRAARTMRGTEGTTGCATRSSTRSRSRSSTMSRTWFGTQFGTMSYTRSSIRRRALFSTRSRIQSTTRS